MQHAEAFLKIVNDAKANIKELTIAETKARVDADKSIKLIDVREDREWALGHIDGAEHIGKGVIERDIETKIPDKDTEVILYCGGGFRSALSAEVLQKMGYTNVASMDGGWRAWAEAGYPIEM
ncbi:MAG: rhodanese-like domain-containing protein [Gemmatimonadetes bacterium]|jgi:rhodanese-related sulfurtransferase|nr:rhodanese-like domain-containing protein [Gemmatimonadota bacterium]